MDDIKSRRRPRFAHVPGVAAKNLVADLDQIMTIEKPLLAAWPRDVGCRSDAELRDFADALSRKFSRFAFPNDFVLIVKNLTERIKVKHGRAESDEGRAFRALREIRVGASPHWNDSRVDLMFYFIRHEEQTRFGDKGWDHWRQKWLNLITVSSRYASVDGIVLPLSQLRADEYLASDRLDFDHLTAGGG